MQISGWLSKLPNLKKGGYLRTNIPGTYYPSENGDKTKQGGRLKVRDQERREVLTKRNNETKNFPEREHK